MIQYDLQGNAYELGIRGDKEMNKIVNGVANDYEFPQLDWVHHDSTTIKIPSDEETTNLAKAIWNYFPLLVEENKTLKQELQKKDNNWNELKKYLEIYNKNEVIKLVLDKIKELENEKE